MLQTLAQPAAFVGLTFDATGRHLYASGGNRDLIYVYEWANGAATLSDSIILEARTARQNGVRYPAGLALSADGRLLYVAENLSDSLAVVDLASKHVLQRVAAGRYPYGVVVAADGSVFASAWANVTVRVVGGAPAIDWSRLPRLRWRVIHQPCCSAPMVHDSSSHRRAPIGSAWWIPAPMLRSLN